MRIYAHDEQSIIRIEATKIHGKKMASMPYIPTKISAFSSKPEQYALLAAIGNIYDLF